MVKMTISQVYIEKDGIYQLADLVPANVEDLSNRVILIENSDKNQEQRINKLETEGASVNWEIK